MKRRDDDRKLINRAKRYLQAHFGLGEPEAYHALRRAAMRGRLTKAAVARQVLSRDVQANRAWLDALPPPPATP